MSADPGLKILTFRGLGVSVVAGSQHGHEDVGLTHLTGLGIDDLDRLAGIVDKHLLAGPVVLPQHHVELSSPAVVQIAKLRVLVAARMNLFVLLPEQLQSDRLGPKLPVHVGEIGWRAMAAPRSRRRKKLSFQLRLAHLGHLFPVELGGPGPAQVITHGSPRHRAASSDLASG